MCRPPQLAENSQGALKAQNCKMESCLSSYFIISLAPLMRDPSMSGSTWCLSNLLPFRSQRTSGLDACAEHTCSPSSDTQCHLTPHLLCMSEFSKWVSSQIPERSLCRSCMPCGLFQGDRKERLCISVFPSIFITIQRTVCLLHTWTSLFHVFLG